MNAVLQDELLIRRMLERRAVWRDAGDWARFATVWHPDGVMMAMVMGGEIYLPGYGAAWTIGRELGIPVAAHIVGSFGMRPEFDRLAAAGAFGPDNLFIHMTGMSDLGWQKARDAGVGVPFFPRHPSHPRRNARWACSLRRCYNSRR